MSFSPVGRNSLIRPVGLDESMAISFEAEFCDATGGVSFAIMSCDRATFMPHREFERRLAITLVSVIVMISLISILMILLV
jgi:hypothetical protein